MTIPMVFLVANGLPFNVLIRCDVLQQHSAVIDLHRGIVSLTSEEGVWSAGLVDISRIPSVHKNDPVLKHYFCNNNQLPRITPYENDTQELWYSTLEEIRAFQRERTDQWISERQAENLIEIYNKYKYIFSNAPGKVKGYQCKINFKEPVNFHRKSYPIACLLYTSRCV